MPNLLGYYGMDYAIPYLVEVLIVYSKGNEVVNVFNKYNMENSKNESL